MVDECVRITEKAAIFCGGFSPQIFMRWPDIQEIAVVGGWPRLRYDRKKAEARFAHLYSLVSGEECHYCGFPSDGHDHRPAIHTLHRFSKGRKITRREVEAHLGPCRLVPCCTICNMGIGSFEGADDNERREEILSFLDFFNDEGPYKGEWNLGAFTVAYEVLEARAEGKLSDEIYALPAVGRLILSHALRTKMGEWRDGEFWHEHRLRLAQWLQGEPRRKAKHFLAMARLASYNFKDGVYGRE
jgi:hypothetical protein